MLAAVAVANTEAMVDKAVVLEDEDSNMDKGEDSDMDVDAVDSTSHTRHDVPIAIWTITPPRNAERHPNRLKPANLVPVAPIKAVFTVERMDTSAWIALSGPELMKFKRRHPKDSTEKPNNDNANASVAVATSDDKPYAFE